MVLALRAGQIDLAQQLSPQEAAPFKNNKTLKNVEVPTTTTTTAPATTAAP